MMSRPTPKAPSSLVKVSRWSLLAIGIFYGVQRQRRLEKIECERRAIEEEQRPAKEAALKAEKERLNQEEMEYLGKQVGIGSKEGSSGSASSDCGFKF